MRAINTIPREEYAERLFEAMRRMNKKISGLEFEEDLRVTCVESPLLQGRDENADRLQSVLILSFGLRCI